MKLAAPIALSKFVKLTDFWRGVNTLKLHAKRMDSVIRTWSRLHVVQEQGAGGCRFKGPQQLASQEALVGVPWFSASRPSCSTLLTLLHSFAGTQDAKE